MPPSIETRATIEDHYSVEGKAELIDGSIVPIMASGDHPSEITFELAISLRDHCRRTGRGTARGDGLGYAVPELSSGRQSFEPDASYYDGDRPRKRSRFIDGAPTFAAEVRSENNCGPAAEAMMAAKRADSFEAGTLVVWDVAPEAELIHVDRHDDPTRATTFVQGQVVDAEPAVPDWRISVDEVFGPFGG